MSLKNETGVVQAVWPEKTVKVADLRPLEKNPRKISAVEYKKLVERIREEGLHNRIRATADLRIIGGHQRIKALKELGYDTIPVLVPPAGMELTDEEFREQVVRDNLHSGQFDFQVLLEENTVEELVSWGIDSDMLTVAVAKGETPPEAELVPELEQEAVSKLGDVWIMGKHRIKCGDSTASSVVTSLLAGASPSLMVTDPPYGVEYDPTWRDRAGVNKPHQNRSTGKVLNDDKSDWRDAWALFTGDVAYVWHGGLHAAVVASSLEASGFDIRSQIIWAKKNLVMGRGHYHWQHEPCWYAVRKGATANWSGDRKQSTLWQIDKMHATQGKVDDGKTKHGTQKPVECMRRPIENHTKPGDAVYEPFSGSGTTIIACELTERACYAIELNPLYVDMAVRRWQNFTGQQAINEATGKPF